jgi:hypothetical protein
LSGTTNTAGMVRFSVSRASVGSYLATVTSLTRRGFTWDTSKGITSASYAFSSTLVSRNMGLGEVLFDKVYGICRFWVYFV